MISSKQKLTMFGIIICGIHIVGVCISFSLNDWIVSLNVIDKDPIIINTYMVKEFNKHEK